MYAQWKPRRCRNTRFLCIRSFAPLSGQTGEWNNNRWVRMGFIKGIILMVGIRRVAMSNAKTLELFGFWRRQSQKVFNQKDQNKTRHLIKTFALWEVALGTWMWKMSDGSGQTSNCEPTTKTHNSVFLRVDAQHAAASNSTCKLKRVDQETAWFKWQIIK